MKNWKKLKSKQILEHPRLNVFEDEVELPSGHKTSYVHFGTVNDAAIVIVIREDGKILIQKEYSYPMNEWLYQLPGGGIEKGESPEQGAHRELQEEVGLTGNLKETGWFYYNNRRSAGKTYLFTATNLASCQSKADIEEEFEIHWFTPEEIDGMIANGDIVNYSLLAAWALYKAKRL